MRISQLEDQEYEPFCCDIQMQWIYSLTKRMSTVTPPQLLIENDLWIIEIMLIVIVHAAGFGANDAHIE